MIKVTCVLNWARVTQSGWSCRSCFSEHQGRTEMESSLTTIQLSEDQDEKTGSRRQNLCGGNRGTQLDSSAQLEAIQQS